MPLRVGNRFFGLLYFFDLPRLTVTGPRINPNPLAI
jgi:hypothetical protein